MFDDFFVAPLNVEYGLVPNDVFDTTLVGLSEYRRKAIRISGRWVFDKSNELYMTGALFRRERQLQDEGNGSSYRLLRYQGDYFGFEGNESEHECDNNLSVVIDDATLFIAKDNFDRKSFYEYLCKEMLLYYFLLDFKSSIICVPPHLKSVEINFTHTMCVNENDLNRRANGLW